MAEDQPTLKPDRISNPFSESSGTHSLPRPPSQGLKIVTVAPGQLSIPDGLLSVPPSQQDPLLGATIDQRYKVEAVLGEGGMGIVYRCRHTIIGKKVAIKVLRADLARDTELTERFLNEAKAASAIGNAHIIDISDFGRLPDGSTYFVMEYLDGTPLSQLIDQGGGPVPVPRILHIAKQLAEGLAAAHRSEIVHRDLKPDNIFLIGRGSEKDFVKILDFGIAKVSTAEGKLTRAGAVFGTPHYMSPEQAAGAPVDHRGDIYSMGVILYELASGKVPFDADNFMGILTQHMYKAPVPIRALVPQPQDVPPGLEAIVLKCLSKRAEQRFQSMDEVIADIEKLQGGLIPDAVQEMMARSGGFNVPADYFNNKKGAMPAPMPASPGGQLRNRWPLFAGIAGVCAAIGIVIAIFAKSSESTASPPVAEPPRTAEATNTAPTPPLPEEDLMMSKQVLLAVDPLDAHVFKGETDLGTSPVSVEVPDGQKVKLEIRAEGYETQALELDGSQAKRSIALTKEKNARAVRGYRGPTPTGTKPTGTKPTGTKPTGTKPTGTKPIGGGEIVDPWAK